MADSNPQESTKEHRSQAEADDVYRHRTYAVAGLIRTQGGRSPEDRDYQRYDFTYMRHMDTLPGEASNQAA